MIKKHLVACPNLTDEKLEYQFSNDGIIEVKSHRWKLYFDRAINIKRFRVGILLVPFNEIYTLLAIKLNFKTINNIVEYKAYIIGLEVALELGIKEIKIYGDLTLIIPQVLGT